MLPVDSTQLSVNCTQRQRMIIRFNAMNSNGAIKKEFQIDPSALRVSSTVIDRAIKTNKDTLIVSYKGDIESGKLFVNHILGENEWHPGGLQREGVYEVIALMYLFGMHDAIRSLLIGMDREVA